MAKKPQVKKRLKLVFNDGREFVARTGSPRDMLTLERKGVKLKQNKPVEMSLRVAWVQDGAAGNFENWLESIVEMDFVEADEVSGPGEH